MRQTLLLAIAICLSVTPQESPATTKILDGNSLYKMCSDEGGPFALYCEGYIRAIFEQVFLGAMVARRDAKYLCVTSAVDCRQVRDVVVKYLRDIPEKRDKLAVHLVREAILSAWPTCSS